MYHALVRMDGKWMSFGLHQPCSWTEVFHSLQRAHGPENVTYIFWSPYDPVGSVRDIDSTIMRDICDANMVQRGRDIGSLPIRDEADGELSLSYGIRVMRESQVS